VKRPSRPRAVARAIRARGLTLIELVLALGLTAVICVALVRLLDTTLDMWERTEERRDLAEQGAAVVELLARDLAALEASAAGDLVVSWTTFDADADGIAGLALQRLQLVRTASHGELQRIAASAAAAGTASLGTLLAAPAPGEPAIAAPGELGELDLLEVSWSLAPERAPDDADGRLPRPYVLRRAERPRSATSRPSLCAPSFDWATVESGGQLVEVARGVLWLECLCASITTDLENGWTRGAASDEAASAWDAWGQTRPDVELSALNEQSAAQPARGAFPGLPRRVRVELEIERASDLARRTRLAGDVPVDATAFDVRDPTRLPEVGRCLLVGEEWMQLTALDGRRAAVLRAQRGTRAVPHAGGELVRHGAGFVREVPIATARADWTAAGAERGGR
jgi:plasmid maintenance system antidote protein VapI